MDHDVGEAQAKIVQTEHAAHLDVRHEVREAHEAVVEHDDCALVERLDPIVGLRFIGAEPLDEDEEAERDKVLHGQLAPEKVIEEQHRDHEESAAGKEDQRDDQELALFRLYAQAVQRQAPFRLEPCVRPLVSLEAEEREVDQGHEENERKDHEREDVRGLDGVETIVPGHGFDIEHSEYRELKEQLHVHPKQSIKVQVSAKTLSQFL